MDAADSTDPAGTTVTARADLTSRRRNTSLHRQSFDGADLVSARLQPVSFTRCSFRAADLRHATLDRCRFKLCDLRQADLRGASLRGISFAGCDLTGADLRDTDLTGARFGLVLTGVPPHGRTDTTGVILDGAILRDVELDQVLNWPSSR